MSHLFGWDEASGQMESQVGSADINYEVQGAVLIFTLEHDVFINVYLDSAAAAQFPWVK